MIKLLRRPVNLFVLTTYFLLSATPFIPLLLGRSVIIPWGIVVTEFYVWLGIWAIFKRPAWFHWLLLPAFLALPAELYLQINFGKGISVHHLGILAESSPQETAELLGGQAWLLVGTIVGILLWWALVLCAANKTRDLDWQSGRRWVVICMFGILVCARIVSAESEAFPVTPARSTDIVATPQDMGSEEEDDEDEDSDWKDVASGWISRLYEAKSFSKTWPLGLTVIGYSYVQERTVLASLAAKNSQFKFHARPAHPTDEPQVVVLVIGESSRFDRWGLNGYRRDTNPLLKEKTRLVSLSNVITAVSATRQAVPVLLSRKPAIQSFQDGFSETSVLSAFKEAGFKTYWVSNQMSYGKFDTVISVMAKEADAVVFLNLGELTTTPSLDEAMLAPLQSAIADPAPKKLIVLHTLGSHWNYSLRHPKQFDKWKPSLFGVFNPTYTDLKIKEEMNNSYDNSILYTDWFLAQVIGTLEASVPLSSLMYISDHGQTLYDGSCDRAFHGHNYDFEFHVPAFVWYSERYGATYPDKIKQLTKNRHARLSTENVFHSLTDMGDIQFPSEQREWSFFSSKLIQHKRYVDSHGWTDYDDALFKGDCREVVDKGEPLSIM